MAIVAIGQSDYAALQSVRRRDRRLASDDLESAAKDLAAKASSGELALFVGAGVSMSAGMPSWSDLVKQISRLRDPAEAQDRLGMLDLAELISREEQDTYRLRIREALARPERVGVSHLLLAGLGCSEVVTTNFDLLYERAANSASDDIVVLPWSNPAGQRSWLLKMHGDIDHEDSIVLSRGDFVRYDARSGPAGAIVQTLLLTKHLLVVGASLTDDNFLRLAFEVDDFLRQHREGYDRHVLGTVVTHAPPASFRKRLFGNLFDYVDASEGLPMTPTDGR